MSSSGSASQTGSSESSSGSSESSASITASDVAGKFLPSCIYRIHADLVH
jgi:hypothetical protein